MAKRRTSAATGSGMPPPADGPAGDFPNFLRASDLGKKLGTKGTIAFVGQPGRKITSEFGEQYAFRVKMNGKTYDWPIRVNSGNHRRLADKFGSKTPKGSVKVELKEFNRNAYIAIV